MYVDLPEEWAVPGYCGKLLKSMYGTRDAAVNWADEYSSRMVELGFTQGIATPCVFYKADRGLRA